MNWKQVFLFPVAAGFYGLTALSTRFAEYQSSLGICDEVETIFTLVPDELIIKRTKNDNGSNRSRRG